MAAEVHVRLTPRAARDEIAGERDGRWLARVTAPPVDGRANEALCRLVAGLAGVAPSKVAVIRGQGAREKTVRVEDVEEDALRAALATPPRSRARRRR